MPERKRGALYKCIIILGALLLAAAIGIFVYTQIDNKNNAADNKKTVAFLEEILPERTPGIKEDLSNSVMPSYSYKGEDYIALIEIPAHSVKLPVISEWNKKTVNSVPCRFFGSAYDGSLIVGGVDREGQFDFVSEIDIGDEVTVTDMRGQEYRYTVKTVKHAKNAEAETLSNGDYDLTLFAKSRSDGDYLLVRCNMS